MDWNLFGCARGGHVTYTPDEPALRDRLRAPTAGGTAWRCLRCGALVTGGQHGSGPAAAAPLIRRGKELRSELILRVFAVERFLRFLILGGAAYGVWQFKSGRAGIERAYNNDLPAIRALYRDLGFDVNHSRLLGLIQHSFMLTPAGRGAHDQPAARHLPGLGQAAVRRPRRQDCLRSEVALRVRHRGGAGRARRGIAQPARSCQALTRRSSRPAINHAGARYAGRTANRSRTGPAARSPAPKALTPRPSQGLVGRRSARHELARLHRRRVPLGSFFRRTRRAACIV